MYTCPFLICNVSPGRPTQTFYIVFTTVDGTYDNVTVHSRIGTDEVTSGIVVQIIDGTLLFACQTVHIHFVGIHAFSFFVSKGIEICLLEVGGYRVACREVEHHNVVQFHFAEARYTFIFPLGPFDVRFGVEYRQCMLCQRHGKRRIRYRAGHSSSC